MPEQPDIPDVTVPFACPTCKGTQPARLLFGKLIVDRSVPSVACQTCGTQYTVALEAVHERAREIPAR